MMKALLRERLDAFHRCVTEHGWQVQQLPPVEGATKRVEHFLVADGQFSARISFSPQGGIHLDEPADGELHIALLRWIRSVQPSAWTSEEARKREAQWLQHDARSEVDAAQKTPAAQQDEFPV
jgi:hypothetical protein